MRRIARLAVAGLIAISSAAAAQAPHLAVLDHVLPGSWTVREIGSGGTARAMCVSDPGVLLQIHHGTTACRRFVVSSGPRAATVDYTCPGTGHGRTTLTAEGSTLVRIQTQGLANGAPFDVDYEAGRGGTCPRSSGD
jgi:hypothetical protein